MKIKEAFVKDLQTRYSKGEISFGKMVELINQQASSSCTVEGYFKVKKENQDYRGERYFSVNPDHPMVVQICVSNGTQEKRGKGHSIGITTISKSTLASNYYHIMVPCAESEYFERFDTIMKILRR